MPRIILKYKSPEFADTSIRQENLACEMPGCCSNAEHKAPKHRGLNEYYSFCFDHVKEYNKAWDFFSGMSEHDIQNHMRESLYGDRPTWRSDTSADMEENLYRAAKDKYFFGQDSKQDNYNNHKSQYASSNTPEHEAMALMGLCPPVTLEEIKTRYKTLAKKHHPDLNKNNPESEELLKKINMAYTILKLAFEEYKNLPENKV